MVGEHDLTAMAARLLALDDVDGTVLVACSGGADSLALLALVRAAGHDAIAAYVDHGLRAASAHDVQIVAAVAAQFGAGFRVADASVPRGGNLEARARVARYAALEDLRIATGATVVAVGHTRDDQAETVLLQLVRGSGTAGLAGMPARRGHLRRPLLAFRRAETRELCALLRLTPVHDEMNDDLAFRRVWLRRSVIPFLERDARRDLVDVLARQAEVIRADDEYLDAAAGDLLLATDADAPGLDARRLAEAPEALARRAVRRWLGPPPLGLLHVDAVIDVAHGRRRATQVPMHGRIERAGNRLRKVDARAGAPVALPVAWQPPGPAVFGHFAFDSWIDDAPPVAWPDGVAVAVLDAERMGGALELRAARAGDRYRPLGSPGAQPVREALRAAAVPVSRRATHPLLVDAAGEVSWVVGYRVAEHVKVTARTRRHLWICVEPSASQASVGL